MHCFQTPASLCWSPMFLSSYGYGKLLYHDTFKCFYPMASFKSQDFQMLLSFGKLSYHNTFKCFYPTANNTTTRMQIVLIKHSSPQSFDFVTWPPDILCWVDWNENPEVKV